MRMHAGEKPYKCKIDNCTYAFVSSTQLKFHICSKHTKVRAFQCSHCGKTFITNAHLLNHFQINHATGRTRNFPCYLCEKSFYSRTQMTKHCRQVHKTITHTTHGNATINKIRID